MEINHDLLESLGFVQVPNRRFGYAYKGVTGRLLPQDGTFYFYDFTPAITTKEELTFMVMAIDYRLRIEGDTLF
ncbi:hypothetical protein GCM10028805_45740 [Spirosoma harenae]